MKKQLKKQGLELVQIGGATLHLHNGMPVLIVDDGRRSGDAVLDDVAQWLGHPLETGEWRQEGGMWRVKVWFHEDCDCTGCAAAR
jgi:hypothetical protein